MCDPFRSKHKTKQNKQTNKKRIKNKNKKQPKKLNRTTKMLLWKETDTHSSTLKKKSFTPSGTNMHVLNIITLIAKIRPNIGSDYCNQHTTTGKHTQTTIQREQLCLESSPTNPQNTSQS